MSSFPLNHPTIAHFTHLASLHLRTPLPLPKDIFHFGNDRTSTTTRLNLAISGLKTSTTSWPIPSPLHWGIGDYSIILDADNRPAALMRTLSLKRCLFKDVEESFALAEAEGTLEEYRRGHSDFYRKTEAAVGREFGDEEEVLRETFEVVFWLKEGLRGESVVESRLKVSNQNVVTRDD